MQFKIQLNYVSPPIWRRFIVPSDISLHTFHQIIQDVMGWSESHLYAFTIGNTIYELPSPDDFTDAFVDRSLKLNSKKVSLDTLDLHPKNKIKYEYDFGDGWIHSIVFEKAIDDVSLKIPICLDGKRNCPPEDCGSYPGYDELCEAMKYPKSEKGKELLEWLGEIYDPEYFDLNYINESLQLRFSRRKKK